MIDDSGRCGSLLLCVTYGPCIALWSHVQNDPLTPPTIVLKIATLITDRVV